MFIDLSPLRRSRDLRYLVTGQLVSELGSQLTAVAVPWQVYLLTHSSLDVGLVSLGQLIPLIIGSLFGGSLADVVDRRRLLLVTQVLMAACSAGLAINADLGRTLWPLFVLPALGAGFSALGEAGQSAMVPNLVRRSEVASANAMFQALFQLGLVLGPAMAGLLLAGAGIRFVYWMDVASFVVAAVTIFAISPQPATGQAGHPPGLRSIAEGLSFVRGRQVIQGAFLIDINATVLGMPRALFPALAANVFGGGAITLGFLLAAPGAGALAGAVTTGWVGQVRRQGRAVIIAVIAWGLAIAGFGLACWLAPGPARRGELTAAAGLTHGDALALVAGLMLLAAAGWADVISAVFRNTIIQLSAPEDLLGRLTGLQMAVVNAGPRLGDLEAGLAASLFGATASVLSGGLGCVAGALVIARLLPAFRRLRTPEPADDPELPRREAPVG